MEKNWMPDIYSDVPVAYAVYKLIFAEDGRTVEDAEYVYVNKIYSEMAGVGPEELLGQHFLSYYERANPIWMTYCAKASLDGEVIHDCIYAPEIGHWLDFTIMPLKQPGYVAYTFINVDLDRERQMEMKREENETRIKVAQIEAMTKYETTQREDPGQFDEEMSEKRRQFDEQLGLDKEKLDLERRKQDDGERKAASDRADKAADREQRREQAERQQADKMALAELQMAEDRMNARMSGKKQ